MSRKQVTCTCERMPHPHRETEACRQLLPEYRDDSDDSDDEAQRLYSEREHGEWQADHEDR